MVKGIVLRRLLARVDGVLAVGTWNKEYWQSYGVLEEAIETALFAVDNAFFASKSNEQGEKTRILRAGWGVPEDGTVILYCAKLIPVKGPEVLFRAFAMLGQPKAHLVVVGTGALEASLKSLQRELSVERVHWEGFVNQSALPAYYGAADVLVVPSRHEPWGLVVNEAMACGTPCIVSDVVGAGPDLIQGKDTGTILRRRRLH